MAMDSWPSTTTIPTFEGEPKLERTEPRLYYDANMEEPAIVTTINGNQYSIRWTGTLTPPGTGDYVLAARTGMWNRDGKVRLFLDDKEITPSGPGGPRPAGTWARTGAGFPAAVDLRPFIWRAATAIPSAWNIRRMVPAAARN